MGSCIKVVKQKKNGFLLKKIPRWSYFGYQRMHFLSQQNVPFSVMGIRKIINSLQLRQKLLRNFLLRLRSKKVAQKVAY
jgi:hypothetical protein